MRNHHWKTFKDAVSDEVDALRPVATFGPFKGEGEWGGIAEESATFTALFHSNIAGLHADRFDEALAALARDFDQDAVAWAIGESHLSGPNV